MTSDVTEHKARIKKFPASGFCSWMFYWSDFALWLSGFIVAVLWQQENHNPWRSSSVGVWPLSERVILPAELLWKFNLNKMQDKLEKNQFKKKKFKLHVRWKLFFWNNCRTLMRNSVIDRFTLIETHKGKQRLMCNSGSEVKHRVKTKWMQC